MTDNTQYWLMKDGVRLGPMTFAELVRNVDTPSAPVWREGLPDWCAAETVPELAGLFRMAPPQQQPQYQQPQQPYQQPLYQQPAATPRPVFAATPTPGPQQPEAPMPNTYLVWSIVTLVLCCVPTGIVAIIYSSKVSSRWTAGDYDGARSASDNAALWIIISIVCGLIAVPFQIFMAML